MTQYYLITPASCLPNFTRQSDREYLSRPVPVTLLWSDLRSRLVRVHDPARNEYFPVDPANLKTQKQLTAEQRKAAGI